MRSVFPGFRPKARVPDVALASMRHESALMERVMFPFPLDTDQTSCFDSDGLPVPCAGSGQDASYFKRTPVPEPRFAVRGDAFLDRLTGALWAADANGADASPTWPVTWEEALAHARALPLDRPSGSGPEFSPWQLPSRRLLFSLISHERTRPALPEGHPFRRVFAGTYWTTDTVRRLPEQAWLVHVGDGRLIKANKNDAALVWFVRPPGPCGEAAGPCGHAGGQCGTGVGPRYQVAEGLARDAWTGLTWPCLADPFGKALSWPEALAGVADLNRRGYLGIDRWRLPNIRELESMADLSAHSPALCAGHPFVSVREGYWSGTTSVYEPRYAWAFYTRDGFVGVGFKADAAFHVWPVAG